MTYKLQVSIKKKEINLQVAIWFLRDAALKGEIYEFQIELTWLLYKFKLKAFNFKSKFCELKIHLIGWTFILRVGNFF